MIIPNRVLVGITRKLPPLWKWLLAYLLTEAYAVAISHYQKAGNDTQKHWYFLVKSR
jgi:predicted branched-subunit amino acid permease